GDHVQAGGGLGQLLVAAVQTQAHQAVTHQHQLADHVHDLVQPRGVDAHGGFRLDRRRRLGGSLGRGRLGGSGSRGGRRLRGGRGRGGGGLVGRRGRARHLVGVELALAVQLVEQRLELVFADIVLAGRRRGRLGLSGQGGGLELGRDRQSGAEGGGGKGK